VTGSEDKTVLVWDLCTFTCVRQLKANKSCVECVAFDGVRVVCGSRDGAVRMWASLGASVKPLVLVGHTGWVHMCGNRGKNESLAIILKGFKGLFQ
jgi:F-box and WD-40 domain protein CDC4